MMVLLAGLLAWIIPAVVALGYFAYKTGDLDWTADQVLTMAALGPLFAIACFGVMGKLAWRREWPFAVEAGGKQ